MDLPSWIEKREDFEEKRRQYIEDQNTQVARICKKRYFCLFYLMSDWV